MKEVLIHLENRLSKVIVGGSINEIEKFADTKKTIVITDENLSNNYHEKFANYRSIVIGTGEGIKTFETVEDIVSKMIDMGADRNSFILAIGGGIVCDVAGFAASIFMRGIKFGFISTSILSQVDASVGGKNGVNVRGFKNMIGLFNQPEFVICDHDMLATLPDIEYTNGLSELIKSASLNDDDFFDFLEIEADNITKRDEKSIHEMIYRSVKFKASIVQEDERESGIRKILNLGHTIGHALEKIKGTAHGFAVAAGMGAVTEMSVETGLLDPKTSERIRNLIDRLGLDSDIKNFVDEDDINEIINVMASDKKKTGNSIDFIMLEDLGKPVIKKFEIDKLKEMLKKIIQGV